MFRFLMIILLATTAANAQEKKRISAEEIYEKHRSGGKLSFFEINRLNSECRIEPNTSRVLALGGKSIVEDANGGPVLVYIDGDVGERSTGQFKMTKTAYEALKALNADGSPNPDFLVPARQGCKGTLLEYGYFGMPVVYGARSGTYGTTGNYGEDIYTARETEAIVTALDELRHIGIKSFILFGFSGGAQAAAMAAAGREDIALIVSAGGMLSREHHPHTYFENDPIRYVQEMPPVMIVHSSRDERASFEGAKAFHEAMISAGRESTFHEVMVGHFETTVEAKKRLNDFLAGK